PPPKPHHFPWSGGEHALAVLEKGGRTDMEDSVKNLNVLENFFLFSRVFHRFLLSARPFPRYDMHSVLHIRGSS
ncbi:MAG TPA: hypothetical protein VHD63_19025, partial [Ktedonobacteraceae bacterium]|nr:hypothetical protein [Ktedonobacteraceae bacterium]